MKQVLPLWFVLAAAVCAQETSPGWKHLSAKKGDLKAPFSEGRQQTASAVFDIDRDGIADFAVMERRAAPGAVWYRRAKDGWRRYVIEPAHTLIEAGATYGDVDSDGDLDLIAGGEYASNEVWWWENPHPDHDPEKGWRRYTVKASGKNKHHDAMWGDFDGDGRNELVFWVQGDNKLVLARLPADPKRAKEWPMTDIYVYGADSQPAQRAEAPQWKRVNEHEGLAAADIDLDGRADIVGGGMWLKHLGGDRFQSNPIDPGYAFSRSAAGQLIEGGRPEVLFVVGDGVGPLILYEWTKGTWAPKPLLETVNNGHSLAIVDFDGDGHLDIFLAEMRLGGGNPDSKVYLLLGDGRGAFKTTIVATGFDNHESKIADLDGDGDLDILGKPYDQGTPDLNIWLNLRKP